MAQTRRQHGPPYPYDCILSGVGCMLEKLPNGEPAWIEKSIEFFQGDVQLSAVDRGYVQFPPEVELPYAWTDLSGGAGISEIGDKFRDRYHYALYADCSTGRPIKGPKFNSQQTLTVTSGATPSQVAEFGGKLYLIVGDKIFRRDDDTATGWVDLSGLAGWPATINGKTIGKCVVFRGTHSANLLFVPIGSANNYYTMTSADPPVWTQHGSQAATNFEVVGDALWLSNTESNQQVIRTASDGGTSATWLGPTYIGDGQKLITWLLAVNDRLLVFKEDGVFAPTDGAAVDEDLTPQLRPLAATSNGKGAISWAGQAIFPFGEMLWKYDPDTGKLEQFGPETLEQNASEVKGPVRAIAAHGNQALYSALYNSANTSSYLAKYGTYRTVDTSSGPDRVFLPVWHMALHKWATTKRVDLLHSTNLTTNPRLYSFVQTAATTYSVQYMVLARTTNPADDPNYAFDTASTGEVYYPRWTGNFPFETKLLKGVGVGGRNLAAGRIVGAQYKVASDTDYTSLGTTASEGGERLAPGSSPTAASFDLKATLSTSSDTATPVLSSFVVYSALRTNTGAKRITAAIKVRDNVTDRRGQPLRLSYENLLADIEAALTTLGSINVVNPKGETLVCIGIKFSEALLGSDDDAGPIWTMMAELIQTRVSYTRGTWSRVASHTWGSLASLQWSDVAVL